MTSSSIRDVITGPWRDRSATPRLPDLFLSYANLFHAHTPPSIPVKFKVIIYISTRVIVNGPILGRGRTYRVAADPHFRHAVRIGHFEADSELVLRQIDVGRHLAAAQRHGGDGRRDASLLARLERVQLQVLAHEPVALEALEREPLGPGTRLVD